MEHDDVIIFGHNDATSDDTPERQDWRKLIREDPTCIFRRAGISHDEIRFAFCGPMPGSKRGGVKWLGEYAWPKLVALARWEEERLLREDSRRDRPVPGLLRQGWAWKWNGRLRTAREKTVAAQRKPATNALPMLFRHYGFGWLPIEPLKTLAELKLGIDSPIDRDNACGKPNQIFLLRIGDVEVESAYHVKSSDPRVEYHAGKLGSCCADLRRLLRCDNADRFEVARVARLIGRYEVELKALVDTEMLDENRIGAVFRKGQGKSDWQPVVEAAWKRIAERLAEIGQGAPELQDVLTELDARIFTQGPKRQKWVGFPAAGRVGRVTYSAFTSCIKRIKKSNSSLVGGQPARSGRPSRTKK